MAASQYDFPIEQGSSFRFSLVYKDKDKNPIDITDYCARLTWTTNSGATQVFTTENTDLSLYNFSIDGPQGKIMLLLPASITNSLNFSSAKYDLELQSTEDLYAGGGKEITRILFGTINIIKRNSQISTIASC